MRDPELDKSSSPLVIFWQFLIFLKHHQNYTIHQGRLLMDKIYILIRGIDNVYFQSDVDIITICSDL